MFAVPVVLLFVGHGKHEVLPLEGLYVPTGQAVLRETNSIAVVPRQNKSQKYPPFTHYFETKSGEGAFAQIFN